MSHPEAEDEDERTIFATDGLDMSLSRPPLAINCCAICIIIGLFIMLAKSGMPPPPPSISARPGKFGVASEGVGIEGGDDERS